MVGKSTGVCDIATSRLQTLRLNISSAHLYVFQPERKLALCLSGSTAARFRGMAAIWTSRLSLIVWLSLLTGRYKTTYMTPIESLPVSGRTTIFTKLMLRFCSAICPRCGMPAGWIGVTVRWRCKVTAVPYSIRVLELIPVLSNQPADDRRWPGGRQPLLSARPAVTFPPREQHRPLAGTKLYCVVTSDRGTYT